MFGVDQLAAMQDIAQDTLITAYQRWSHTGVPAEPSRWLFRVAKNKAINYSKRERKGGEIFKNFYDRIEAVKEQEWFLDNEIEDSMLRMIFACASPQLTDQNKVLLFLNVLSGFTRKEIAHALLMKEEGVKKRLFRIKKEIRDLDIRLEVPPPEQLEQRLEPVMKCLYLLFNEGYNSSNSDEIIRKDICLEALRLTQLVVQHFSAPTAPKALLALMCFHIARFDSRLDHKGTIILFQDQDRDQWNTEMITHGDRYLHEASRGDRLSSYHLEAAIAAEHCHASSFEETNWNRLYRLYQKLYELKPSPIVQLNMAIIESKLSGLESAIHSLEKLGEKDQSICNYYLYHSTLGEMYRLHSAFDLAKMHFQTARQQTNSITEQSFIDAKLQLKNIN